MKKFIFLFLIIFTLFSFLLGKGGCGPFLASCCIGPRIGLEMNEGTKIRNSEWLGYITSIFTSMLTGSSTPGRLVYVIDPFNGRTMNEIRVEENLGGVPIKAAKPADPDLFISCLTSFCIGPRVGLELNDGRQVRTVEWLCMIPLIEIFPRALIALEAFSGKTMSEIALSEQLDS